MKLGKYSMGIGDRFAHQGKAQLKAFIMAKEGGIEITPVWNKSNREHTIIHSEPAETRIAADKAVQALKWQGQYFVDADHINIHNVDWFMESSDFFTLDVADYIGKSATDEEIALFVEQNKKYIGQLEIPGIDIPFTITEALLKKIGTKFVFAIKEAGRIYRHIESKKGKDNFITEVSMDEVNDPQTPVDMFFILSAIAAENIPAQTIAPKFTGRFNKGVDYVGNLTQFEKEFEQDLLVIDYAIKEFGLPDNLKLSIHSGSDKFSLYPKIKKLLNVYDKGVHLKTAGTTWLEEIIGLALAGGTALELVKNIYIKAFEHVDELCKPYATVIDIDTHKLPIPADVKNWSGDKFANSLQHIQEHPDFNPHLRQLIHVGYKIAAEYSNVYLNELVKNEDIVGAQVTENIYKRHISRLFNV